MMEEEDASPSPLRDATVEVLKGQERMSLPYVCPLCNGSGKLPTDQTCPTKPCHACGGEGIVWSPDADRDPNNVLWHWQPWGTGYLSPIGSISA